MQVFWYPWFNSEFNRCKFKAKYFTPWQFGMPHHTTTPPPDFGELARASPGPSFSRPEAVPQEGPHDDSLCAVSQRFVHVLLFRFLIHLLSCSVIF
jgi:hypothetical protein